MRIQRIISFVCGLILLTLSNGCVTRALWQQGEFEAWNQPATDPHLHLFAAKPPKDILVVYDEYSERKDASRKRAYWLRNNQSQRLDDRHAPQFVNPSNAAGCISIPVFSAGTNDLYLPEPPYALLATNGQSFTLHLPDESVKSYDLPFYEDRRSTVEKVALTPLANVADATIIGGVIGYFCALAYLDGKAGGYNPSY